MNETFYPVNYTQKVYKPRTLNNKQLTFCEAYIAGESAYYSAKIAGYKSPSRAANHLLSCSRILKYINRNRKRYDDVPITVEYKMEKLQEVIEATIPSGLREYTLIDASVIGKGISAIGELNKMQGHYAAEKHVNVNIDTDVKEAQELMAKLVDENKQEY